MKYVIREADAAHDSRIIEMLERNPMPGRIEVILQCRPSFLEAQKIKGDHVEVVVAERVSDGGIAGVGTRSTSSLYVDGKSQSVGYLSGLRIDTEERGGTLLARAYKYLRVRHNDGRCNFYVTTIIDDNVEARRILTSKRAGLPEYHDWGGYCTAVVTLGRIVIKKAVPGSLKLDRGSPESLSEIVDFVNNAGCEKQFFPVLRTRDFVSGRFNSAKACNWYLLREDGKIVAAALKWDQRDFKQSIVKGYNGLLKVARPLLSVISKAGLSSGLPRPGEILEQFCVSFHAAKDNDPTLFEYLFAEIYNDNAREGYRFCLSGFHENDPLLECMKNFVHRKYWSRLYLVTWGGRPAIDTADKRIPYLEVGCL